MTLGSAPRAGETIRPRVPEGRPLHLIAADSIIPTEGIEVTDDRWRFCSEMGICPGIRVIRTAGSKNTLDCPGAGSVALPSSRSRRLGKAHRDGRIRKVNLFCVDALQWRV